MKFDESFHQIELNAGWIKPELQKTIINYFIKLRFHFKQSKRQSIKLAVLIKPQFSWLISMKTTGCLFDEMKSCWVCLIAGLLYWFAAISVCCFVDSAKKPIIQNKNRNWAAIKQARYHFINYLVSSGLLIQTDKLKFPFFLKTAIEIWLGKSNQQQAIR